MSIPQAALTWCMSLLRTSLILALSVKASESLRLPRPGWTLSFHVSTEKGNSAPYVVKLFLGITCDSTPSEENDNFFYCKGTHYFRESSHPLRTLNMELCHEASTAPWPHLPGQARPPGTRSLSEARGCQEEPPWHLISPREWGNIDFGSRSKLH